MDKDSKLATIAAIVALGFIVCTAWHYVLGYVFGMRYPYNTFVFDPRVIFSDFTEVYSMCSNLRNVGPSGFVYNPFAYVLISIFTFFSKSDALLLFQIIFIAGFAALLITQFYDGSWPAAVGYAVIIGLQSYPFLFALDRANIENFIFLLICAFVLGYSRRPMASSAALAVAIACKPLALIYVALLIANRDFKRLALTLGIAAGLTVVGLAYLSGTAYSLATYGHDMGVFYDRFVIGDNGLAFGHSLFGALKYVWESVAPDSCVPGAVATAAGIYKYVGLVLGLVVAVYASFARLDLWKRVTLIVGAACALPPVSADYRLLYLFLPIALFVNAPADAKYSRAVAVLFGLLLIPKDYIHLAPSSTVTIGVLLEPILLVLLACVVIASQIARAEGGDP